MKNNYTIKCLFGQRKGSYSGQYAPELLRAYDEYSIEENPDLLESFNDEKKASEDDFEAYAIIDILVPQGLISAAMSTPQIEGEIK